MKSFHLNRKSNTKTNCSKERSVTCNVFRAFLSRKQVIKPSPFAVARSKNGTGKETAETPTQLSTGDLTPNSSKLLSRDTGCRVEVSDFIEQCLTLKNTKADNEKREEMVRDVIVKMTEKNQIRTELYAQLTKKTKILTNAAALKNAWQLFTNVSMEIRCPVKLSRAVEKHVRGVADNHQSDPLIRVMAREVLGALRQLNIDEQSSAYGSIADRHPSKETFTIEVFFPDGTSQELMYDRSMLVSDAVTLIAWRRGVDHLDQYALYEDRGDGCLFLNQNRRLLDVLLEKFCCRNIQQRLLFKRYLSRVTEQERKDQETANTSYVHWKEQYRKGDYHVRACVATHLCYLLIQARIDRPSLDNHDALSEAVSSLMWECFPERVYREKTQAEWKRRVLRCFEDMKVIPQKEAQLRCLQVIRGLRCDDCFECTVKTGNDFPLEDQKGREVKLAVSCSGLLFFSRDPCDCLHAIRFNCIQSCEQRGPHSVLKLDSENTELTLQMDDANAKRLSEAVRIHGKKLRNRESTSLSTRRDSHSIGHHSVTGCHSVTVAESQALYTQESEAEEISQVAHSTENIHSSYGAGRTDSLAILTASTSKPLLAIDSLPRLKTEMKDFRSGFGTPSSRPGSRSFQIDESGIEKDGFVEDYTPLMGAVENLQVGDRLNKYLIESGRVEGKPHLVYAQNIYSKDAVILKFYSSGSLFKNSIDKHCRLKESKHICKIVDVIEEDGFPPCIAFEKADCTLKEWLQNANPGPFQRKEALHQILCALAELHQCGIVHCDLKPDNIMFFDPAHKLKLVDLDSSVLVEQESVIHSTIWYSAPEIELARKQGLEKMVLDTSADMWSFGIIVFEVMSGCKFFGQTDSPQKIKALLCSKTELIDAKISLDCIDEPQVCSLIRKLVRMDPTSRMAAAKATKHAVFRSAMTTSQKNGEFEVFSQKLGLVMDLTPLPLKKLGSANVMTAIRIEGFEKRNNRNSCRERRAKDVFTIADDSVPENPVFVLRAGKKYRLVLVVHHSVKVLSVLTLKRVVGVKVLSSGLDDIDVDVEKEAEDLQITQPVEKSDCRRIEVSAELDLQKITNGNQFPTSADSETEHVPLDVIIAASMSEDGSQAFNFRHRIFCQIVHPEHEFDCSNVFIRKNKWDKRPQWEEDALRAAVFLADISFKL